LAQRLLMDFGALTDERGYVRPPVRPPVEELNLGSHVHIEGLTKRPELDGEIGEISTVRSVDDANGRYGAAASATAASSADGMSVMALKAPESAKGSAGKASAGKASVGKGASSDKAGSVDHAEAAGTSSGGSATKKEGEPKVSRPRAETLKLIKARTSYQIFAEEERPAASAAARERVLATYQEAVGLRPDGKPKKVDEGEAAFKKDLAAAVVLELGKRWRALTPEQKEPFEERARKEKEAVAGDDRGGLSFDDEQARADAMLASLYLPRRKREPKRRL